MKFLKYALFWVFGVFTCAFYAFETLRCCAQTPYLAALFLPLMLIPVSNAAILLNGWFKSKNETVLALLGSLNGLAIVVASILTIVLAPLWLLAGLILIVATATIVGVVIVPFVGYYFCVAVVPLLAAIGLRRDLRGAVPKGQRLHWLPASTCVALVMAAILVCVFPTALTQECEAAIEKGTARDQGLLLLRAIGDEQALLRDCYSEEATMPWYFSELQHLTNTSVVPRRDSTVAREVYYRVKGKPFNTVPRPWGIPRGPMDEDWEWNWRNADDKDFAADTVGGIAHGMRLTKSTIAGFVDADDALGHLYWTMQFRTDGRGRELRGQVLLPPGAVVTGCSLWINGVKHDCLFATRESSRRGYVRAANSGDKPLLVSTAGAGRVLLQSSTGWWGQDAVLTLQITTPMILIDAHHAMMPMPSFTERNFEITAQHELAINSKAQVTHTGGALLTRQSDGFVQVSGTLTNDQLTHGTGTLTFERDNKSTRAQVAADPADPQFDIVQRTVSTRKSGNDQLMIVLDGSAGMAHGLNAVCDVLDRARSNQATIIWSGDSPKEVVSDVATSSSAWHKAVNTLRDSSCLGGQNNAEALAFALRRRSDGRPLDIVWLHGPQPVKFEGDKLFDIAKRSGDAVRLYEYQISPGPNEVVRSLDQLGTLVRVPQISTVSADLSDLFALLAGERELIQVARTRVGHGTVPGAASMHAQELSQLYTDDWVMANLFDTDHAHDFGALAEQHELVTPLTSAIVLPTVSSYSTYGVTRHQDLKDQPGKQPANSLATDPLGGLASNIIPAKPEPPMWLLLTCALLMMAIGVWINRKQRYA